MPVMGHPILLNELALLASIGLGWLLGWFLHRRVSRAAAADGMEADATGSAAASDDDSSLGDALAFVGGALGILLGLLLIFGVDHFTAAREATRQEAVAATALFNAVGPFESAQAAEVRRDLVCFMRSATTDDWAAAEAFDYTGSEDTNAWADRLHASAENLSLKTDAQGSAHYFVLDNLTNLGKERQLRLLLAQPEIPPVIWLVINLSAFVFVGLLAFHMPKRRWIGVIAILASTIVLAVIVATLTSLDRPFEGRTASLTPVAMDAALKRMQDAHPDVDWSPCPVLAQSVIEN